MSSIPNELSYTKEHEWVSAQDSTYTMGITDYAQDALGDVVFVQLPESGKEVLAGQSCSEVESTKSVSDIYVPISGLISNVNTQLSDSPNLINSDPYGDGWMVKMTVSNPADVAALMSSEAYAALVG